MANINDARNTRGQLDQERTKLSEAAEQGEIAERDREAIDAYASYKKRRVGSIGTVATYLNRLRTSATRVEKPLVAFENTLDVEALLDAHEDAGTKAASTLNNHLSALRGLLEWLDGSDAHGHDDYSFRAFIENVEPSDDNPGRDAVDPEFVLSGSEVADIREAASHPREEALSEFLADAGPRIALACQMRCGDVTVNREEAGTFRPNPNGIGHKKVPDRNYRLHESQRHLRRWLNSHHPEAPDTPDEAPLFPVKRGYDPAEREECALSPSAAEAALKKAAEAAGIDSDRAHPHNWRRTAVTRMRAKHDMSWNAIQLRTGWSDQSLAEMKHFYRRIDEADKLALVDRELGVATEEDAEAEAPEPEPCINCGANVPPHGTICPACGTDQSLDDPRPPEEVRREQVRETVAEMLGPVADGDLGEDPGLQALGMMLTNDDLPDPREGDGTSDVSEERAEAVRDQLGLD
jgi:integrase